MAKASFNIVIPLEDDAPIISDIHLRAMNDNLLTHAQFPTPQALEYFRSWITKNTAEHIADADKGVLVATDPTTGEIASFIKWLEYGADGESASAEDEWPEFCGRQIIQEYTAIAADARKKTLGGSGYCRKFLPTSFVGRCWPLDPPCLDTSGLLFLF
ncbi:hypothetical protein UVI_02016910 [Ustilaginoidea virens]|uniref:Acyl-CoA N-acyltransferase n=1 Tax=Ustilaginoidea virens TaxID=1159556 RepID=A0A1B5KYX7_USTVR|nr:hypothetical protein UVI_02016910 [Ustilaginoidea virens]